MTSGDLRFATAVPPEQVAALARWAQRGFVPFPKSAVERSIPERFGEQVGRHAARVAVHLRDQRVTYAELDQQANRVAWTILGLRRTDPEPIALLLEQGVVATGAALGVLKAGHFYVPLDPGSPGPRNASILRDVKPGLLLTDERHAADARALADGPGIVNLDELDPSLPVDDPHRSISPDSLAWVVYTSGSTGQPKGVVQTHRNALHLARNYCNYFRICPDDNLTMLFVPSVSAAAHGMLAALLNGACLHPFNPAADGFTDLPRWVSQHEITIFDAVPTVFRQFVRMLTGADVFPRLRLLFLAGEPLYKRDVTLYQRHFGEDCLLLNRLGSSETGSVLMYFIDKHTELPDGLVPVGYPVEDHEVALLGQDHQPVAPGDTGQIAVRTRYVTPGYWGRPDLTEARFLRDPRGGDTPLYLTGDWGRFLPDGRLVCVGRRDAQIKVRGHTVDIAEVEGGLRELLTVRDVVVVLRPDRAGNERLVAYVVPTTPAPTLAELRRTLAEQLPAHMVPTSFVLMDALPTAPNGKVALGALPEPSVARPPLETPFLAPRTPMEASLAGIWTEVLALETVGVRDDFLELGGDSLLAARIVQRVLRVFELDLAVPALWQAPTVADMALVVMEAQAGRLAPPEMADLLRESPPVAEDPARPRPAS